jgi:GT2 family glycosyltransferase/glycosyltransferase involved in cell wall biosynthesis
MKSTVRQEVSIIEAVNEVFDPIWYTAEYRDVAISGEKPIFHFLKLGLIEQRNPNRFFASRWYLQQHADVRASGIQPLMHYLQSGAPALRDPHPDFDAAWYAGQHPEAAANPLLYHIRTGHGLGYATKPSSAGTKIYGEAELITSLDGFFDAAWYQGRYPDTVGSGMEPIVHFIRHGIAEKRDPNPFFNSSWYQEHNPDVGGSGIHPLVHYLISGAAELRSPHPDFDAAWYVEQHPQAVPNPLIYHLKIGLKQGFKTERPFELAAYLPAKGKPPLPPDRLIVDVVIPAYRGLDETKRCITSVLAAQGKPLGRVIVVEDRSPDPELVQWLIAQAACGTIHLLRNATNLGFAASVNRGIEAAGNRDVVLLNSDTEVPADWLVRLAGQAYANPHIATVSPLSNNATICSYPSNDGGAIPVGYDLDEMDAACRNSNSGRFVEVPTTVGFCMYIRRKALRQVGLFDAKRFKSGYGEENDFCLRASRLRWTHRIACDTFVYHQGSVSFAEQTKALTARAMKSLVRRYPSYQRDIAYYVADGAINPYRFALTAALFGQSGLPCILMVSHGLGGGVRRHIDSLMVRFRERARFLLLEGSGRGARLSVPEMPGHPTLILSSKRLKDLATLLRSMNVSRMHIHHLMAMDMDIAGLIHELGVPFDVTVHDYLAICPQINLLPSQDAPYCGEPDVAGCNRCIARRSSFGARDILTWRANHAWQFREAARVLCPSQDVLERLRRHGLADNAKLAPHEPVEAGRWRVRIPRLDNGPMRVAVLGALPPHKGAKAVARVAQQADPKQLSLHLIGFIEGNFPREVQQQITITGRYDEADLPQLIRDIDPHVIWFPATAPETFSFTLSAALEAGVPIVARRIGAFPDRLKGRPLTWLVDPSTSPTEWISVFKTIYHDLRNNNATERIGERAAAEDFYATQYLILPHKPIIQRNTQHRRPRIAILPERFDAGFPTPCGYIRLLQPLTHPSVASDAAVVISDGGRIFKENVDIIITQRYAIESVAIADHLAAHCRRRGIKLVYDLDDDLLHIPQSHPDAELLRPRAKVVRKMLRIADAAWLSTQALAEQLSDLRPDALVVENQLDERIWMTPPLPNDDGPIRILCMGTTTHEDDFALLEPALARLKAEYGDKIEIEVMGVTLRRELAPGLVRVGMSINAARSYPGFVDWLCSYQPAWHIGLAPLIDNDFNRCKSALKVADYAALGLVVLASDVAVYRGSIADGQAGQLVANNAAAWYAAIDQMIREPEMRRIIASRSRSAFLAHASLGGGKSSRRDALLQLLAERKCQAA